MGNPSLLVAATPTGFLWLWVWTLKKKWAKQYVHSDHLWYVFLIIYIVFDISVVPSLKRISHIQNAYIWLHTLICHGCCYCKMIRYRGRPLPQWPDKGNSASWRNRGFRFLDGACSIEQCVPAEVYTHTFVTGLETSWKHHSLPISRISRYQINTDMFTSSMSDLVFCASGS